MIPLSLQSSVRVKWGIGLAYFLLFVFYLSPVSVPYKGAYPLAFLTLCAFFSSSRLMAAALFFSAVGDYMGICHHFWGQMSAFALAHVAYIVFFLYALRKEERVYDKVRSDRWKAVFMCVLGVVIFFLIPVHVNPLPLRVGVTVYSALILIMCWNAWRHPNPWYAVGAWLFVFSDFVLAWNKFNSPILYSRYWIMVPYLWGQCLLFLASVKGK